MGTAEEVCSTETVATQEIEYEKKCTEIVDTLCDAPVAHAAAYYGKREADAEAEADADADAQYFAYGHHAAYAAAPVAAVAPVAAPLPVAHAVAHSVTEATCADVENKLPKTTCEAVVTSATSHAVAP